MQRAGVVGVTALAIMGADGSEPRILTEPGLASDSFPSWSPTGGAILFVRSDSGSDGEVLDAFVVNRNGTGPINLSAGIGHEVIEAV